MLDNSIFFLIFNKNIEKKNFKYFAIKLTNYFQDLFTYSKNYHYYHLFKYFIHFLLNLNLNLIKKSFHLILYYLKINNLNIL